MPEYIEIHLIVAHVQTATGLTVSAIEPLGAEYASEKGKADFRTLLTELRSSLPFTICGIAQRGKEIAIVCSNCVWMVKFGQGNYMYYLTNHADIQKEPFKSDGYLALKGTNNGKEGALLMIDCRNFRHQIEIWKHSPVLKAFEPMNAKWNMNQGPCVINSNGKIKENILEGMKNDPEYFNQHSVAFVLFDDKYFNGLGTYTVSEILARIPRIYPYKAWDLASKAFADLNYLETVVRSIPIFALEVVKYYATEFNPVTLTAKQIKQRKEFRFHCIQVYRRLRVNKRRREVYFFHFKQGNITRKIFIDGRHIDKSNAPKIDSSFEVAPSCEKWIRRLQSKLQDKVIGTGPQEWQLLSMQNELKKTGVNAEKQPSFAYQETILKQSSKFLLNQTTKMNLDSNPEEKKKRKRKRSGNRGKILKRRQFTSGEKYNIPQETPKKKKSLRPFK